MNKETIENNNLPLRAEVLGSVLSITIGESTLAFAFENSDRNHEYDDDICDYVPVFRVTDPKEFIRDICHELNRESEDGSTPLTRFLDGMMNQAVDNGSLGVDENES